MHSGSGRPGRLRLGGGASRPTTVPYSADTGPGPGPGHRTGRPGRSDHTAVMIVADNFVPSHEESACCHEAFIRNEESEEDSDWRCQN
jgi:hypothetical protein